MLFRSSQPRTAVCVALPGWEKRPAAEFADGRLHLAVCLTLLGRQLNTSADKQEKQKPSQPIRLHAVSLCRLHRLPSAKIFQSVGSTTATKQLGRADGEAARGGYRRLISEGVHLRLHSQPHAQDTKRNGRLSEGLKLNRYGHILPGPVCPINSHRPCRFWPR